VHYRDNWYLDAYCHLREDLRSFAVDAIQNALMKDTHAKEVPKAELDEYLGSGYGIFAGRKVAWATLKFTARAARWVSAQRWHPDERHRIEKDGSYVLEIPYADDRELVMEIMRFGPEVEVLAPVELRQHVADLIKEAGRPYASSP
jgi:predicted DNA-binding transcriptional regulator YafY